MPYNEEAALQSLKSVLNTVYRLRAPGGCPWDQEQTHQSLRPFLLEETYETLEVLDQVNSPESLNDPHLKKAFVEEWGDLLLQILLNAEIASETHSDINLAAVAQTLNEKLIRRHPHVFGEVKVSDSNDVVKNWAEIKKAEKGLTDAPKSTFDGISNGMAPIPRTMKVISKVTKVGFQWPDLKGPTEKLEEEVSELKEALLEKNHQDPKTREKIESEIGDVLFSICNIAHFLKMDPEAALRSTLRKFESRFRHVETRLQEKGSSPEKSNLDEMDHFWDEAKQLERNKS